jgi:hypothetical protein
MKYTYEEIINGLGEKLIKRTDEIGNVSWIPTDEANTDYQAYLEHEATAK